MAETVDGDASAFSAVAKPKAINGHSMSDNQIAELHERLIKAKFKIEGLKALYPFQLGWNACLELVHKQMRIVCDDPLEPVPTDPVYDAMKELAG